MFFRKYIKSYFEEIIFQDEFYLDGVDIFQDENRVKIKNADIRITPDVDFKLLINSEIFRVKGLIKTFKIGISYVHDDFYVISYLNGYNFRKVCSSIHQHEALSKNDQLTVNKVIEFIKKDGSDHHVYSKDYRRRADIQEERDTFKVTYQCLEIADEMDFHFRNDISSTNFWVWEYAGKTSYFDTFEHAYKEIEIEFR